MTDCKYFPDHLIYSTRKMAASRSLSPRIPGVTLILQHFIRVAQVVIIILASERPLGNEYSNLKEFWKDLTSDVIL
jgi:hypothetical protein